jgi:hypothetical protein
VPSFLDRPPPRSRYPDADDLNRSAASLHVLKPRHRKPAFDEVGDHVAVEPMNEHKQLICSALRIAGEQFQACRCSRVRRGLFGEADIISCSV